MFVTPITKSTFLFVFPNKDFAQGFLNFVEIKRSSYSTGTLQTENRLYATNSSNYPLRLGGPQVELQSSFGAALLYGGSNELRIVNESVAIDVVCVENRVHQES